jgi:hypothetical protein
MLQALNPQDRNLRFQFCVEFKQRLEEDRFADKLVFSDEATFYMCGNGNPHVTVEHVRDSPKLNMLPFPLAKPMNHFTLRSQLLPVSTTWTCCNCG